MKRVAPLVEYASSSEDDAESDGTPRPDMRKSEPPPKRRKLPTLSSALVGPAHIDNPALHEGRVRTAPHVEGQYAAYVYVPVKLERNSRLLEFVRETFTRSKDFVPTLHPIPKHLLDLDAHTEEPAELHISISRPIYVRSHQREELKQAVRRIARSSSPFNASFATFSELQNDEKTRTFLTLEVGAGHNELRTISEALIPTLRAIRQKEFYSEPRFHASFGWALMSCPSTPVTRPTSEATTPEETSLSDELRSGNEDSFSTIERFPEELVPTLKREFGPTLLTPIVGIFEVDSLCVRIGKDINRWKLTAS